MSHEPARLRNPPNRQNRDAREPQGELGELDAQAGFSTQPLRAPAVTVGEGDNANDTGGGGDNANGTRGDANGARGGGSSSSTTIAATAVPGGGGGAPAPPAGFAGPEGDEEAAERENGGGGGGGQGGSAASLAGRKGSLTDVMAHELVIDCLVRLALVAGGEAANEVLSVLEHERGRAHARERLGRGAIGPMEEVVAKVGVLFGGTSQSK